MLSAIFALSACSLNVKKGENGDDKKVDIQTPMGGIHVDKDADAENQGKQRDAINCVAEKIKD